MAKIQRKPLEKKNALPHFKVIVLIPIVIYLLLTIWFFNNDLARYLLIMGLAVVEAALVVTDGVLRKKQGGRFDRGDIMLVGAAAVAVVYMIYLIVKL